MDLKALEEAGLTTTEAKIYFILLEQGSSLAGTISRNTGIHRRSVYDAIERLIEKGLVSYIKTNNRKYFEAADPSRLLEIIKEKEQHIQELLPKLNELKQREQEKKETLFFRGRPALKTVFDDQIKEAQEILILGDDIDVNNILKFYFPHFDRARKQKKISIRMLISESARSDPNLKKIPLAQIRFVDKPAGKTSFYIYKNTCSIVVWEDEPKAILIRESAIAQSLRDYFEILWRNAK
ncbi:hypothetical protein D6774_03780 [Candidatus Woesearchaeota archaeon]|nr:MAG: hypothetical protein D6774_03780 [Candidatus Woesearchaeota archaeon]